MLSIASLAAHIPYLDNRHTSFLYKLWLHAHVRFLPDQNTSKLAHLPVNATLSSMKSGAFGCITSNMKQVVSKLCNICPLCLRQQDFKHGRGYTSFPGDPRLLQLLSVDNPVFFYASCDILPPFWVSYALNCRKGKYPIYVLNTVTQ